jgi:hypothetical protein
MKIFFALFSFIFFYSNCLGQSKSAILKGRLMDIESKIPLSDVQLFNSKFQRLIGVDSNGNFDLNDIPYGEISLIVLQNNEAIDSFMVSVSQDTILLGDLFISGALIPSINLRELSNLPSIVLEGEPNSFEDEPIGEQQNISIVLNSETNRDPFLNAVSFVFGQYNFRPRSYNRATQQVLFNGILLNDLNSGIPMWSQWGGLNEATKNQTSAYGLTAHQQAFGGVNGAISFDLSALEKSKSSKFAYSLSNRSYNQRVMYTYNSGINAKGWAQSISASRRWADQAYFPGTSFESYAFFYSIAKKINSSNQISLNVVASQNERARSGSAIMEVIELANNKYYNPNWGWQNGEKRNARMTNSFQPFAIVQHQYKPNNKFGLQSSVAFQMGQNANSSLDWYNAIDPRPDYYRNLPSYYQSQNPLIGQDIYNTLKQNPNQLQIDWVRLYEANRNNQETLYQVNGNVQDSFMGKRSLYVVGSDVERMMKAIMAVNLQYQFNTKVILTGAFQFAHQNSNFYRRLDDLLGGDYFLNYNMFAVQNFLGNQQYLQFDANKPNQVIKKGDRYRYDYTNTINKGWLWAQLEANFRKFNGFASMNVGFTNYRREGHFRNGLYAQNSFGKSEQLNFLNYAFKGGITYKINGRNYLLANGFYAKDDPGVNQIFVAPRLRNQTLENIQLQGTQSIEFGYLMKAPKLNIRAIGYATDFKNTTSIQRFYNDDPQYQSFVNFVLTNVNTRHIGTELALAYNISTQLTLNGAASIGQAFYTNRPKVSIFNDNDTNTKPNAKEVFIKDYYLGVGPQSAYTLGWTFNGKKFWFVKVNGNYFDRNFVSINPDRRSVEAAEFVNPSSPLFAKIFNQEKLPSFYTFDFSGGKSWRLKNAFKNLGYGTMLYLNFGVSNVLNNRKIISSGFEQLRYDFTNNDPDKFPNKYVYGLGRTFFANLSLKF